MVANELMLYVLIAVAIMSVLMMVRLTRAEEEAGRLELIRSLPTGRLAPPTAGLLIVATANLLVGLAVTVGVLAVDGPAVGSLALGAATALTGMLRSEEHTSELQSRGQLVYRHLLEKKII